MPSSDGDQFLYISDTVAALDALNKNDSKYAPSTKVDFEQKWGWVHNYLAQTWDGSPEVGQLLDGLYGSADSGIWTSFAREGSPIRTGLEAARLLLVAASKLNKSQSHVEALRQAESHLTETQSQNEAQTEAEASGNSKDDKPSFIDAKVLDDVREDIQELRLTFEALHQAGQTLDKNPTLSESAGQLTECDSRWESVKWRFNELVGGNADTVQRKIDCVCRAYEFTRQNQFMDRWSVPSGDCNMQGGGRLWQLNQWFIRPNQDGRTRNYVLGELTADKLKEMCTTWTRPCRDCRN